MNYFIHLIFIEHLPSPGLILGSGNTEVNKTEEKNHVLLQLTNLMEGDR